MNSFNYTQLKNSMLSIDEESYIPICPYCNSSNSIKNGKIKDRQRYLCKECKKSYNSHTNTIISHSRKSIETWDAFISEFINNTSVRKAAKKLGINPLTSFYWRHKIMKKIEENNRLNNKSG